MSCWVDAHIRAINSSTMRINSLKTAICSAFLTVGAGFAHAQTFDWAGKLGGPSSNVVVYGSATDAQGNVLITGQFQSTVDMDPGTGVTNLTANNVDAFAIKVGANGNLMWAKQFGGSMWEYGRDVAVGADGSIAVAGYFEGQVDFDPGPGTAIYTAVGGINAFVVKLTANGDFAWARTYGTAQSNATYGYAVDFDAQGNVVLMGSFEYTVDFDPGVLMANITSAGSYDYFVVKLDALGEYQWARGIGSSYGEGNTAAPDLGIDGNGNIYITGELRGLTLFDPINPNGTLSGSGTFGERDIFLASYTPAGVLNWVKNIGGQPEDGNSNFVHFARIGITPQNKVVLGSGLYGQFDLIEGVGEMIIGVNDGFFGFVAQFAADGTPEWARTMDATILGLATDAAGRVFITGAIDGDANMDMGNTNAILSNNGMNTNNPFLAMYSGTGSYVYGGAFYGNSGFVSNWAYTVAAGNGNVYSSGIFSQTVDFDPSVATSNLAATTQTMNARDGFVVKFGFEVPACQSASLPIITANPYTVNQGESVTLILDGVLNDNAYWIWVEGFNCDGQSAGSGTEITITPQFSGTWSVRGMGGTCANGPCQSVDIEVIPATPCVPATQPDITASATTVCEGESVTLTANGTLNDNDYWQWYGSAGCDSEILGTGNSITVSPMQTLSAYSVRGRGSCQNGPCQTIDITVDICSGLAQATTPDLLVYESDHATLRINTPDGAQLRVVDLSGRQILTGLVHNGHQLDLSDLPNGLYTAMLLTTNGQRQVLRIVR